MSEPVPVEDLDAVIEEYKAKGYRLDMIFPADGPREARMSRGDEQVVLRTPAREQDSVPAYARASASGEWIRGRAGMEYRDLIPDRLGGSVVASHIRLRDGGEVPDYVHYHKLDFQVIYCLKGRIKVVYEYQGEPFWLEPGDLVLQPSGIRHRVLECTAGAEVVEISSPAEHETWVEHHIELPTGKLDVDRLFGRRRFFRHVAGQDDARDEVEALVAGFAESLTASATEAERLDRVTTFSRSLSQS